MRLAAMAPIFAPSRASRITSYNVCYTKLLRDSVYRRMTLDTPQTIPWLNQLVMMWRLTPEANNRSPSVETMLRERNNFV